jgi:hypothetical protein
MEFSLKMATIAIFRKLPKHNFPHDFPSAMFMDINEEPAARLLRCGSTKRCL